MVPPKKKFDIANNAPKTEATDFESHLASNFGESQHKQQWNRPPVPETFNPKRDDLTFQQIEIEQFHDVLIGPVIRMYGITESGNSIFCKVQNFLPYFYIPAISGLTEDDLKELKTNLCSEFTEQTEQVVSLTIEKKMDMLEYNKDLEEFLKISCASVRSCTKLRGLFERGRIMFGEYSEKEIKTYDNISFDQRFMVDLGIQGMSWISLPASKYILTSEIGKESTAQIEVSVQYEDIIVHPPEGEWVKMAPLRILSLDIECAGRKGIFPDASIDPVIQIASICTRFGESKPFIRNVFCLDTCGPIAGTEIFEFESQDELLLRWNQFFLDVDPDVVIGYNIVNFDMPYLMKRATAVKCPKFGYFTRLKNVQSKISKATFSSKAYGTRDSWNTNMNGRLQFDLLQVMQREYKLRSYSLNSVSALFLGEQKEDVHHSIITDLFNGTPETRRRLAVYCLKDAFLPQRLLDKLMCFINYTEMSRVTGVSFNYLLARGQQIKVVSQLFRKALAHNYLMPNTRSGGAPSDEVSFQGATVIEPIRAYYDMPIATLDFSSLYPSIMQAHNICYTTMLSPAKIAEYQLAKDIDYEVTPTNHFFIKREKRVGLLPEILEDLLSARKRAKAELKKETDPFKKAVLDGRQLALKISANSVYGFTGATNGKLPCLEISSSVTAYGREMIEKTKFEVENHFNMKNNYTHNAQVIYGDTDSVMVKFGPQDLKEVMQLGQEAANYVTEKFIKPIKLEFEKVYFPYLLMQKKRYAGVYWTNPDKYDKIDTKGIETVRRDNCPLVSDIITTVLNKLLIDRNVDAAIEYVKESIFELLQNKVDMSQLVISKALVKSDYTAKQAHVELAERMRKRDAGSAPNIGDRVEYVIIKGAAGDKLHERVEDPVYVLEKNLPIDTKYYLENQLENPLTRIFEPILGNKVSSLFNGDHTRIITKSGPKLGALSRFTVKTANCMRCKGSLPANQKNRALCVNCLPHLDEYFRKVVLETNELSVKFSRLWTQCQRCQGSLHQDVLCTSRDCPIFYMRIKTQKDMNDLKDSLSLF